MATASEHVKLALHNIDVAEYLAKNLNHFDWVAIVACYATLHIIEAVFFSDPKNPNRKHTTSHKERSGVLSSVTHYRHIASNYSVMTRAAYVARYLQDETDGKTVTFSDFIPPADVKDKLISHRMHQVIQSASSLIDPALAQQIEEGFTQLRNSL